VVPAWLHRITVEAAARGGVPIEPDDADLARMVDTTAVRLLTELTTLLRTDVDEQRTNPLSLFRDAVAAPTALLHARDVPVPSITDFDREMFPDDHYGIGPATWADVHPDLHEPGLTWGAWKALTVLRRRRAEGRR
jgi:hypothetical protein